MLKQNIYDTILYYANNNNYWPYRLFFYSSDAQEPYHVHVERDENIAKFWLEPLRLAKSGGFNRKELNRIAEIIQENITVIQEAWNDYFND